MEGLLQAEQGQASVLGGAGVSVTRTRHLWPLSKDCLATCNLVPRIRGGVRLELGKGN